MLKSNKGIDQIFLNEKNKDIIFNNNILINNKNAPQLSPVYYELIQKLWSKSGSKVFYPHEFKNKIQEMNPIFKEFKPGDSKDLIIFILDQLHKELKKSINFKNENDLDNKINSDNLNKYDKKSVLKYFFRLFKRESSIISDIFFGFKQTTSECLYCKNIYNSKGLNNPIRYNYEIFNCLIFPLKEVEKMKNNNYIVNNNNQNDKISLEDCFYYNQKTDLFSGENKNYCNICNQLNDFASSSKILKSPNVLILILDRDENNKFDIRVDFEESIDITQFVLKKDKPKMIYNLYGVIGYFDLNDQYVHFISSCKNPINNEWYLYDDTNIIPYTIKEIKDLSIPYILFYRKNKDQ